LDGKQAADQSVDAGVRRVGHDSERVAGPAERADVQLEHRDPAAVDALAERRRPTWVELHGEHATAGSRQREGQRTVTGPEVDHHVSGTDG
jgi:hypothetical protein